MSCFGARGAFDLYGFGAAGPYGWFARATAKLNTKSPRRRWRSRGVGGVQSLQLAKACDRGLGRRAFPQNSRNFFCLW
jgi:hypothetical protein